VIHRTEQSKSGRPFWLPDIDQPFSVFTSRCMNIAKRSGWSCHPESSDRTTYAHSRTYWWVWSSPPCASWLFSLARYSVPHFYAGS